MRDCLTYLFCVRDQADRCEGVCAIARRRSTKAIDEVLTRTSPGNNALGYMDDDTFNVFYVGRSDSDVSERLHEWVGNYDAFGGGHGPDGETQPVSTAATGN